METKSKDYVTVVTTVSMEWLKANLTRSIDGYSKCSTCGRGTWTPCTTCPGSRSTFEWDRMFQSKIGHSLDDYAARFRDGIRKPICLVYCKNGEWMQGNGHHRLSYAYWMNLESIDVVFSFREDDYMMDEHTDDFLD